MLEGGDRTVVGEDGLEMCEDLRCRRSVREFSRQLGRRAPPQQCRADRALILVEPFPDSLQGPVTEIAVGGADGGSDAASGALEERHRQPVVKLSRRILSASQTLKVRPQPGRRLRLLQKTRCARTVLRCGLLSPNPYRKPCRISVPIALQCGQVVCLSRSAIAINSSALR